MSTLSADLAAVALVAAARAEGVAPERVYEPSPRIGRGARLPSPYRARTVAAAGLRAVGQFPVKALAKAFALAPTDICPAGLAKKAIGAEQLLVVAEALRAEGLIDDSTARERFLTAWARPSRAARKRREAAAPPAPMDAATRPTPDARRPTPDARRPGVRPPGKVVNRPVADGRLRPVSAATVKHAARLLDARWDLQEVAELFDVCPDALLSAIEAG